MTRRACLGALATLALCACIPSVSTSTPPHAAIRPAVTPAPVTAVAVTPSHSWPVSEDTVEVVSYSPDGTRIATGLADGTVAIWDAAGAPEPLAGDRLHHDFVSSVAWSPDGRWLATGSTDGEARVYDALLKDVQLRMPTVRYRFVSVCWSPSGTELAVARGERSIDVYRPADAPKDGASLAPLYSFVVPGQTTDVAWSHDGAWIAAGNRLGDVVIASTASRQVTRTVSHPDWRDVASLAWSPDSSRIAAGYASGTVVLYDPLTGMVAVTLPLLRQVNAISWSPNGRLLATTSLDFKVFFWSAETGKQVGYSDLGVDVNGLAWSPDGSRLAAGTDGHTLAVFIVGPPQGVASGATGVPTWTRSYMPQ